MFINLAAIKSFMLLSLLLCFIIADMWAEFFDAQKLASAHG